MSARTASLPVLESVVDGFGCGRCDNGTVVTTVFHDDGPELLFDACDCWLADVVEAPLTPEEEEALAPEPALAA